MAAVELFHTAPLLATGMCLVDTPGLGSVFEANTEETRAFVPHIDAALVVLGADPPIGADELALVDEVGREVDQLVFVLNKADKLTSGDIEEARRFTERILTRQLTGPFVWLSDHVRSRSGAHAYPFRRPPILPRRFGAPILPTAAG